MSRQLVSLSPDLLRLQEEGYDLDIRGTNLLVRVPYATAHQAVASGFIVSELTTSGGRTTTPSTHVVSFVGAEEGDLPCDNHGQPLNQLINSQGTMPLGDGLVASCTFSHKPDPTYPDYYEKMSTYADMLVAYAQALHPDATAKTHPPIPADEDESVFRYFDSMTSRTRIGAVTDKLRQHKIVLVGVGGTGSYILDLVSKTPVAEIHLYDRDTMLTHNAFRTPGAASLAELEGAPKKVDYLREKYDPMHRHIVAHDVDVDASNIEELRDASFVFVSIDGGKAKKYLLERLDEFNVPFVDVGVGVYQVGDSLGGLVRTTTGAPGHTNHIWETDRISFADDEDDEYDQNIQIADLNMLNAAFAVIQWKKHVGFYTDFEYESSSTYTIDGNHLLNEDQRS